MLLMTTTPTVEGRPVKDYLGIVSGEAMLMSNILDNLAENEQTLLQARQAAMAKMSARAATLTANAVVGVHFDYEIIGGTRLVVATGTAVHIP